MQIMPIHATQLILDNVGIEAETNAMIAATATNTAVQAPWLDKALKAVDTETKADPATKM